MPGQGNGNWNGADATEVHIEIALEILAKKLAEDPAFIDRIATKVRKAMTKNARSTGNLFGHWAQGK